MSRLKQMRNQGEENSFGLSFVDLVSGGFGAAFFLFLVFAALPVDQPAKSGGGSRFVEVWLDWPQIGPQAEILIAHDNGPILRMSGRSFTSDPLSGALKPRSADQQGRFWRSAHATGFSWSDRHLMTDQRKRRTIRFRFIDPCPGELRFWVNLHSAENAALWLTTPTGLELSWHLSVLVSDGRDRPLKLEAKGTRKAADPSDFSADKAASFTKPVKAAPSTGSEESSSQFIEIKPPRGRQSEQLHCN